METSKTKTTQPEQKDSEQFEETSAKKLGDVMAKMGDTKTVVMNCPEHGEINSKILFLSGEWMEPKCSECEAEAREAEETRQKEREKVKKALQRQAAIEGRLKRSGIPKRFQSHTLNSYHPPTPESQRVFNDCVNYAENFPEMKKLGRCMIFTGTTGTGKTHLSCGIANHIIQNHMAAPLFISALDMVRKVKETYSRTSEEKESDVIRFFLSPDLLIVDEIGVQFGSDAEKMILFEIINKRYEEMLPTFLLSNLALKPLSLFVGDRIIDRMKENGGTLHNFTWPSHRSGKVA